MNDHKTPPLTRDQAMLTEAEAQRKLLAELIGGALGTRAINYAGALAQRTLERDAAATRLEAADERIARLEARLEELEPSTVEEAAPEDQPEPSI